MVVRYFGVLQLCSAGCSSSVIYTPRHRHPCGKFPFYVWLEASEAWFNFSLAASLQRHLVFGRIVLDESSDILENSLRDPQTLAEFCDRSKEHGTSRLPRCCMSSTVSSFSLEACHRPASCCPHRNQSNRLRWRLHAHVGPAIQIIEGAVMRGLARVVPRRDIDAKFLDCKARYHYGFGLGVPYIQGRHAQIKNRKRGDPYNGQFEVDIMQWFVKKVSECPVGVIPGARAVLKGKYTRASPCQSTAPTARTSPSSRRSNTVGPTSSPSTSCVTRGQGEHRWRSKRTLGYQSV